MWITYLDDAKACESPDVDPELVYVKLFHPISDCFTSPEPGVQME